MHASTFTTSLLIALVLPACVLDTKLIDNPIDLDSDGAAADTGDDSTTYDPPTTTAPTSDATTDAPVDDACSLLPDTAFEWYVTAKDDPTWTTIDESCTVVASEFDGDGLEVTLDCPQHAAEHGPLELALIRGPLPAAPQPGDVLDVFFRPMVDDLADPHPQLLFLRSEGELVYASALGSFIDPDDVAAAAAGHAPLTAAIEPGPCDLADNPYLGAPTLAGMCAQQAIARLHVGAPDTATRTLDEFTDDEITVDGRTYAIHALSARRGSACGAFGDIAWGAHAIALKSP